ncbi:GGDEF domain-containing protein, partial [Enterococcus faecalis]|uniref:GGDEF domain-containing protein n=1 Tax=Enterococcus faecalis TaxID=1351 RepID=UPI00403F3617
ESEAQARRLAESDPLTGALNRRSFDSRLAAMVAEAQASGGEIALVLIDLDKFKRSNDTHGHQAGDAVLLETARRVADLLPRGG